MKESKPIYTLWETQKEKSEKERGRKLFKEIMVKNFPNLEREMDIQIHEAQKFPNNINPKKTTPRHNIIRLSKVKNKERILKASREN